jgi:hypothetical protein
MSHGFGVREAMPCLLITNTGGSQASQELTSAGNEIAHGLGMSDSTPGRDPRLPYPTADQRPQEHGESKADYAARAE